jgi:hypothetical protein
MLIANIAEEANRKVRDWEYNGGPAMVATPTDTNGSTPEGPRNGMRQSTDPLDRGRQFRSSCSIYPPTTFPGRLRELH